MRRLSPVMIQALGAPLRCVFVLSVPRLDRHKYCSPNGVVSQALSMYTSISGLYAEDVMAVVTKLSGRGYLSFVWVLRAPDRSHVPIFLCK